MSLLTFAKFAKTVFHKPQQLMSNFWADRNSILSEGINLFCWQRKPDPVIHQYLEEILKRSPKPIRLSIQSERLTDQLMSARLAWDSERLPTGTKFWDDVSMIVSDFLTLAGSEIGTMHLKVVSNNACSKFHVDGYSLRLFTTYLGKGTEWIPESATNRNALGKSNELILKDPSRIQQMKPFEVGILKGELSNRLRLVKGIVHRSPEIDQLNKKRIILRVDI